MSNFTTGARRILCMVVAVSLLQTVGSISLSQAVAQSTGPAAPTLSSPDRPTWLSAKLNRFMVELAKDQPANLTPLSGEDSNLFGLRSQVILVPHESEFFTYRLGESLLPLPNPGVSDLAAQTTMTIENGDLVITHNKRKIQQRISGFKFHSMKSDGQFIFLLSDNGDVHAMNARVVRKLLFQGPIPIFKVAKSSAAVTAETRLEIISETSGPVKLSAELTEELQPADGHPTAFSKGDVYIHNNRETVDLLNRAEMSNVYLASSKYLALLCYQNDPQFFKSDGEIRALLDADNANLREMQKLMADPVVQKALQESPTPRALASIPPSVLKELLVYLQTVSDHLNSGPQRKRLLMQGYLNELRADVGEALAARDPSNPENKIRAQLRQISERVQTDFKATIFKASGKVMATVQPQNLQRVAIGLGVLAGVVGVEQLAGGHGSQAALSFAAQFWNTTLAAWSTPGIGRRTGIGVGVLLLAPFLYEATGYLGGLVTGKDHKNILNKISFQIYGFANSYLELFTSIMRQSNLMATLRRGINPLTHREALNSPFASLKTRAQNRFALENKVSAEKRLNAMAYALAHATLYDRDQVNPAVAAEAEVEMAQNRGDVEGVMERRASRINSARQNEEMSQLALAIRQSLHELSDPKLVEQLRATSFDHMEDYLEKAAELHAKLKQSPKLEKALRIMGQRAQILWERQAPRSVGIFASESTRSLRDAEANPSLADQNLRVFYNAFTFELLVASAVGDYANVDKPHSLLANGEGPFGLNHSFFAQQLQSIIFLSVANPAKMFLDFELRKDVSNQNPTPDQLIYPREEKRAGILKTAKDYALSSTNLVKMNMGYYALRHLGMSWLFIMPALTMAEVVRVGVLGQSFDQAMIGEVFRNIGSYLAYGYLWSFETRSITLHEQETHAKAEERKDAEYRLNQGLIERDPAMTREGLKRLFAIYAREGKMTVVTQDEIDQAQEDIFEIGHEVLKAEMENPVVPDKANRLFLRLVTVGTVLIGSKLSSEFFTMAYKSGQTTSEMMSMLGHGIIKGVIGYSIIWAGQTALNKLHEKISLRKQAREERERLGPNLRCEALFAPR